MTPRQKIQYEIGVSCYKLGLGYLNPWGKGNLLQMCAFSAGYYDAQRGLV